MTLTEFLLARIAEDEGVARATLSDPIAAWAQQDWIEIDGPALEHVRRHDPHRALAQCAAYREIVELHAPILHTEWPRWFCPTCSHPDHPAIEWGTRGLFMGFDSEDSEKIEEIGSTTVLHPGTDAPCATLRALAGTYADHPNYREEWRP